MNDKIDKSTADQAFDPATRLILFKMINNGIIESVHGILSTGKEAVIVFADGGPGNCPTLGRLSEWVITKIVEIYFWWTLILIYFCCFTK